MSDSERNISEEEDEEIQSSSSDMEEENPINSKFLSKEKITIQKEQNDNRCATYVFHDEDHTLGNMLRVILSGHADVQFVGYSIPHPSDNKMNLRLQTLTQDSNSVLAEGFKTLQSTTKLIREKFTEALNKYEKRK